MPTSYHIILSDSEDEHYDSPITIILSDSDDETPPYTSQYVTEEEEEEEEELEPQDEPSEDEPSEDEPSEDEQEEPHLVTPTAPTQPARTPSFRPFRNHPNGPLMMCTPRKTVRMPQVDPTPILFYDPYIPPSSPTVHRRSDIRRWTWVPDTIRHWRLQEGSPFPDTGASSSDTQAYPVTGEPSHHTIPLLIARMTRHETQIEHLENSVEVLPGPEHVEDLQQDVLTLEHHYQNLRDYTELLADRVSRDPNRLREIESRLDGLEQSLGQFHTLADTMRGYASYILKGDHTPK